MTSSVSSGTLSVGEEVVVLPDGHRTQITAIETFDGPLDRAAAGQPVAVGLADVLDVSRGAIIAPAESAPTPHRSLTATICWMGHRPLTRGSTWLVQHGTTEARCKVQSIEHKVDLSTLSPEETDQLQLNDMGSAHLALSLPLMVDRFETAQATGRFIIIDPATHETVGAALIA